jgi:hypothetical protein
VGTGVAPSFVALAKKKEDRCMALVVVWIPCGNHANLAFMDASISSVVGLMDIPTYCFHQHMLLVCIHVMGKFSVLPIRDFHIM